MGRGPKAGLGALAAGVAALVIAAVAIAGGPIGGGPVEGLYYHMTSATMLPGGTSGVGSICSEPGTHAVGGGIEADTGSSDGLVASSAPYDAPGEEDSRPDDGWAVTATNLRDVSATVWAWSICAEDKVKYRSTEATIKPGKTATVKATCPNGTKGTAGGLANPIYQVQLSALYPFDGDDAGNKLDDGWAVQAYNYGSDKARVSAYALCVADVKISYGTAGVDIGAASTTAVQTTVCADDAATSGGGARPRPPLTPKLARITAMITADSGFDGDSVPDDRLSAEAANDAAQTGGTIRFYTACLSRG
jgi:hypothetical protein